MISPYLLEYYLRRGLPRFFVSEFVCGAARPYLYCIIIYRGGGQLFSKKYSVLKKFGTMRDIVLMPTAAGGARLRAASQISYRTFSRGSTAAVWAGA